MGLVVFSGLLLYQQRTSESGRHIYDLPEENAQISIQVYRPDFGVDNFERS